MCPIFLVEDFHFCFYFRRLRYVVLTDHWNRLAIHFVSFPILVPVRSTAKKRKHDSIVFISFHFDNVHMNNQIKENLD